MNKIYYRDASVVILVYDITRKSSFDELKEYWYKQLKEIGYSPDNNKLSIHNINIDYQNSCGFSRK